MTTSHITSVQQQEDMHIVNYNDILSHYIKIFVFEICARLYISDIIALYPTYHEQLTLFKEFYVYSQQITMVSFAGSTVLWLFADDESASFTTSMAGCIKLARLLYLLYTTSSSSLFLYFQIDSGYSIIELVLCMYFIWSISSLFTINTNHVFIGRKDN